MAPSASRTFLHEQELLRLQGLQACPLRPLVYNIIFHMPDQQVIQAANIFLPLCTVKYHRAIHSSIVHVCTVL